LKNREKKLIKEIYFTFLLKRISQLKICFKCGWLAGQISCCSTGQYPRCSFTDKIIKWSNFLKNLKALAKLFFTLENKLKKLVLLSFWIMVSLLLDKTFFCSSFMQKSCCCYVWELFGMQVKFMFLSINKLRVPGVARGKFEARKMYLIWLKIYMRN